MRRVRRVEVPVSRGEGLVLLLFNIRFSWELVVVVVQIWKWHSDECATMCKTRDGTASRGRWDSAFRNETPYELTRGKLKCPESEVIMQLFVQRRQLIDDVTEAQQKCRGSFTPNRPFSSLGAQECGGTRM